MKKRETYGLCPHCSKPIKMVESGDNWLWNFEKAEVEKKEGIT